MLKLDWIQGLKFEQQRLIEVKSGFKMVKTEKQPKVRVRTNENPDASLETIALPRPHSAQSRESRVDEVEQRVSSGVVFKVISGSAPSPKQSSRVSVALSQKDLATAA